ncbi:MAG: phosphopantothenoylcysteine decarboxylase [Planctomycetes bacterium]|nr:phosphopantothenoylcysteine decarboxylase [Planctomycetota bacterium]
MPRVVVTAGPTREYVDPVRFLTNESSGRMGFAIAAAAAAAGARVTLIAGPVALATPPGVERIDVTSAREMLAATRKAFVRADVLVMAAAVADFRPVRRLAGKWRAKDREAKRVRLELTRNPDILATVARRRGRRIAVGFALETADGERRARKKLERKGLDLIVLNDESALNARTTTVTVLDASGGRRRIVNQTKERVARELNEVIGLAFAARHQATSPDGEEADDRWPTPERASVKARARGRRASSRASASSRRR